MDSLTDPLRFSLQGPVARITLNRPEVRNAFNEVLIAALTRAITQVAQTDAIRVLVLAAQGPVFCAGADLNWMHRMAGYSREENLADAGALADMLHALYSCPKPTIARVQGDVYAGGVGLVAACDIAVGVESSHYCLSETRLGLVPATIGPYVVRAIGLRAAQRYALSAERFTASEANRMGLLHEVVPDASLDATVDGLAQTLARNGPAALRITKRLLHEVAGHDIDASLQQRTVETVADVRASDEGREGVASFLDKRQPNWLP